MYYWLRGAVRYQVTVLLPNLIFSLLTTPFLQKETEILENHQNRKFIGEYISHRIVISNPKDSLINRTFIE